MLSLAMTQHQGSKLTKIDVLQVPPWARSESFRQHNDQHLQIQNRQKLSVSNIYDIAQSIKYVVGVSFYKIKKYKSSQVTLGLSAWHGRKESTCQCRNAKTWIQSLGPGRVPGEGKQQPTTAFSPGKFHGQRSLEGYRPWGGKKHD